MSVCLCSAVALSCFSDVLWSGLSFRLFCILVLAGQCIVGAWRAAPRFALLAPGALSALGVLVALGSLVLEHL